MHKVEATEESSPAGAASAAVATAPVLPRAREHTQKKKKGMSIAVSSCRSSKKQKPLFEEDTSDAMDLFGSMGLGSALDTALKTDNTKVSEIISTVKRAPSSPSSRLAADDNDDDDDDDDSDSDDGGGWGDDDGWGDDSDDDILDD